MSVASNFVTDRKLLKKLQIVLRGNANAAIPQCYFEKFLKKDAGVFYL